MVKGIIFLASIFLFLGCSQNIAGVLVNSSDEFSKQLLAQKEKSDKEVAKLEA